MTDETIDALDLGRARLATPRLGRSLMREADADLRAIRALIAEVERLRAEVARLAPVWDEEAVVEAMAREAYRRLHPARVLTPDGKRTRESDVREMGRAYATWDAGQEGWAHGITCRKIASHLLAVVREHLPVKPDRETVALKFCLAQDSTEHMEQTDDAPCSRCLAWADAVIALLPGRTEAEVKAGALGEVRTGIEGAMTALDAYTDEHAETARTALRGCLRVVERIAAEAGAL